MAQKQRTKTKKMSKASIPTMNNDVFKNNCVKVKPVLKPDVDVVEPVVKLMLIDEDQCSREAQWSRGRT